LAGTELEEVVERPGVIALRMRRANRVKDHLAQLGLGRGEGKGFHCPTLGWDRRQNEQICHESILPLTIRIVGGDKYSFQKSYVLFSGL
jgi:hypothetical protein